MRLSPSTPRQARSSSSPILVLATSMLVGSCAAGGSTGSDRDPGTTPRDAGGRDQRNEPDAGSSADPWMPAPMPDGGVDPNEPVAECPPGKYEGVFECELDPQNLPGISMPFNVSGPIVVTFEKGNGEFLQVVDGEIEAAAVTFFGLRASLNGSLHCGNGELDLDTENGEWALGDPDMPIFPGGSFESELKGSLRSDTATPTIAGTWTLDDPNIGRCSGTWSATHTP